MIVARRYLVRGRVQGVGFRFFVEAVAAREGVGGYVRNLPDGRVEVVAEGDEEAVERLARALHRGPAGARVDGVDVEPLEPTGRYTGFGIRG
jgi:acylphosphatase